MGVELAGWAIALVLRVLYRTLRVRCADPTGALRGHDGQARYIFAFWHDGILLLPLLVVRRHTDARVAVMLSWHRDAEIAAQAIRHFGMRAVRGSSTRGWLGGLRGLLAARACGETIVVVPDGPRGPRHRAKDGVVQLARATALPVVAVGAAARPGRRLRTWERLQVPLPFARVGLAVSAPVELRAVDAAAGRAAVERALAEVDRAAAALVGNTPG